MDMVAVGMVVCGRRNEQRREFIRISAELMKMTRKERRKEKRREERGRGEGE